METKTEAHDDITEESAAGKEKHSGLTFSQIFCIWGGIFALFVQAAAFMFYAGGLFSLFGRNVTIISAMELILLVFNINKAIVYRSIFGMLLGLLYYVLLGLMLKCFGTTVVAVVHLLFRHKRTVSFYGMLKETFIAEIYFRTIVRECLYTYEAICIFMVASSAVTSTEYGSTIIYLSIAFGIVALLRAAQGPIERKKGTKSALLDGARGALCFFALVSMAFFLRVPCIKTFVDGCSALVHDNLYTMGMIRVTLSSVYSSLVAPVLIGVLQVMFLRLFDVYRDNSDIGPIRKKILILLLAVLALGLVFRCILVSATGSVGLDTFVGWLRSVKNTLLPLAVLIGILFLLDLLYGKEINSKHA